MRDGDTPPTDSSSTRLEPPRGGNLALVVVRGKTEVGI